MAYVLLGVVVGLIPSFMILWLLNQNNKMHQKELASWILERERMMNRCMTKEWSSYIQMNPQMSGFSNSTSEYYPGMSDEEELRRAGQYAQSEGVGEILAELDTDVAELGLRPE